MSRKKQGWYKCPRWRREEKEMRLVKDGLLDDANKYIDFIHVHRNLFVGPLAMHWCGRIRFRKGGIQ